MVGICKVCKEKSCRRSVYGIGLLRRGCNFCVVCPSDEFDGQPPEAQGLLRVLNPWDIVGSRETMRGEFTLLYDLFCEISSVKHAVNMITVLSHGRSR